MSRAASQFGMRAHRVAVCAVCCALGAAVMIARADEADDAYLVVKVKKAITVSGEEITDAMIVITGGRIEAVGKKVDYPSDSRVIDASDLTAMPGLINPRTTIGLPRLNRNGNQSHKKLADDFYPPDDETYKELLEAGFTMIGLYPPGGGMPGQYLVQTTHEPREKTGLKDAGLIRVSLTRPSMDKRLLRDTLKQARAEIDKEKEAATKPASQAAPAGRPPATSQPASQPTTAPRPGPPTTQPTTKPATTAPAAPKVRPELEPWIAMLKKQPGVVAQLELARASDVLHFAEASKDAEFARTYAFSGFEIGDLHNVIEHDLLGGADALVALPPTLPTMPLTVNTYNLVQRFVDAGCTVTLFPTADTVDEHRHLRERVALLVRAGLNRQDALKSITLNAAKYLQMEKEYGTIEKEKWADLIFLNGDPLDPTSTVRRVMIHGQFVLDLDKKKSRRDR